MHILTNSWQGGAAATAGGSGQRTHPWAQESLVPDALTVLSFAVIVDRFVCVCVFDTVI